MDILTFNPVQFVSLLLLLLFLLNNNYQINASHDNETHQITKRLDVDICADHFDTRSSTIIRTEESRAMGAKFVNDDDVSSAAACMKLCCETSECDVFVFEEKSTGSCFLFHCGTSDDFRCKFTTHSNYTSGVLTATRKELESPTTTTSTTVAPPAKKQTKLSQNELELVNLKRPSSSYHLSSDSVTSTTTSTVAPPFAMRLADVITTSTVSSVAVTKASPCGRFQFECQTSKECIAIYNVCDQITQCEDGSDEGPECATVASGTRKDVAGRFPSGNNFAPMPRPNVHNREDPLTAPKYPTMQNSIYSDTETENAVGNQQPAFANRRPSSKSDRIQPNQYLVPQTMDESIFREQQQSSPQWPQLSSQQIPVPKQTNSIWPEKLGRKNSQYEDGSKSTSRKKVDTEESEYSDEYAEENHVDNEEVVTTTVASQKKKPRKHKKIKGQQQKDKSSEKSLHEQLKQLKSSATSEVDVQILESAERPTGAVLSLTLGCLILAALSILISVRLRSVKIRRRRGKSTEEADYLVNGLYL